MVTKPRFNRSFFIYTTILASVCAGDGMAAGKAVSGPNAMIDIGGGIMEGDGTGSIAGVGSLPVTDTLGVQVDTLYRQHGSVNTGGLAGHFFTRDPESHLLGGTALWYNVEGRDVYRFGVESEWYFGDLTFAPSFGTQHGDLNRSTVGYYDVDVSYYLHDNLKFTASSNGFSGNHGGYGEVEWQPDADMPLSLYATIGDSNESKTYGMVGLRFSFGNSGKTLKYRNRYDDPENILRPLDQLIGNSFRPTPRATGSSPSPGPSPFGG